LDDGKKVGKAKILKKLTPKRVKKEVEEIECMDYVGRIL